jgi:hypothetical protein
MAFCVALLGNGYTLEKALDKIEAQRSPRSRSRRRRPRDPRLPPARARADVAHDRPDAGAAEADPDGARVDGLRAAPRARQDPPQALDAIRAQRAFLATFPLTPRS